MIYKVSLCILVALCATIGNTNAQDGCIPRTIDNVYMLPNATLTWQVLPDEPCTITDFVVYISEAYAEEESEIRVMETTSPYLDVSFLTHCRLWNFSVVAVSYDEGSEYFPVFVRVPLADVSDLDVDIVSVTQTEAGVLVLWQAENHDCADSFRVEYRALDSDVIRNRWSLANHAVLTDVPFCSEYEFSVIAFHNSIIQVEGPPSTTVHTVAAEPPIPPRMVNISRGATYLNMTWALEDYSRSHCQITSFRINGAPNFAISIPIQDSPLRAPIDVQILNLRADTMYVFRATVINEAGESDPFPVAAQTTGSLSSDAE